MTEFWNIWTSILPLAILTQQMLATEAHHTVYLACIICQSCSLIYHTFNSIVSPRTARILYTLDLAGVCCMSIGSPALYTTGIGTEGLQAYMGILFTCMSWCLFLLIKSALNDCASLSCAERWIMVLSAIGNYPALARPATAAATATILAGYVVFFRLRLLGDVASHALWHCAVFAGQLGFCCGYGGDGNGS